MDSQEDTKRMRTLTEKGQELFETRVNSFTRDLEAINRMIDSHIVNIDSFIDNPTYLEEIKGILTLELNKYLVIYSKFKTYVQNFNTDTGIALLGTMELEKTVVTDKIKSKLELLNNQLLSTCRSTEEPLMANVKKHSSSQSVKSACSSRSSKSSNISELMLEKRAKAEAAKAKLKIIEEEERLKTLHSEFESKIKREQAEKEAVAEKQRRAFESRLNILESKKEVVIAEAELSVIQEVFENENSAISPSVGLPSQTVNRHDIVNQYVSQISIQNNEPLDPTIAPARTNVDISSREPHVNNDISTRPSVKIDSGLSDLTRFIMKKDLVLSRLSYFEDRPERYYSWKKMY